MMRAVVAGLCLARCCALSGAPGSASRRHRPGRRAASAVVVTDPPQEAVGSGADDAGQTLHLRLRLRKALRASEVAPTTERDALIFEPARRAAHQDHDRHKVRYLRDLWCADSKVRAHEHLDEIKTSASLRSRVLTGLACGVAFTAWVFSGDALFTVGMAMQAAVAQLEYFRISIASGATPARRIVMCSSVAMMVAAYAAPHLHEIVYPLAGTWTMLWLLLMRPNCSSISDISTTLMGLFYTAYLPSWWVRLRCSPLWASTSSLTGCAASIAAAAPGATMVTAGAIAVWWTAFCVACADIGAYFGGKRFGRHSLAALGLGAAAKASPNKTIEGALAGFAASALCGALGAHCMRWRPAALATGAAYGLAISMIALVGDLTASMLKRDGAVKDFGDLLPGHGGLLDRLDGFIFVAPVAFCFLRLV